MKNTLTTENSLIQTAILAVLCFSLLNQQKQQSHDRTFNRIDNLLSYTEQRKKLQDGKQAHRKPTAF